MLSACTINPDTPYPSVDTKVFEKNGGTTYVVISGAFKIVYDESLGYTEKDYFDQYGDYKYGIVDCGWVTFKHFPYYKSYNIVITAETNLTGEDRCLTVMLQNKLNGKSSGKTSLTVIQKGD